MAVKLNLGAALRDSRKRGSTQTATGTKGMTPVGSTSPPLSTGGTQAKRSRFDDPKQAAYRRWQRKRLGFADTRDLSDEDAAMLRKKGLLGSPRKRPTQES